jgi:hypothetical protein
MATRSLVSKLFRNDTKLQACLVNDASHILMGARGTHVAKIQLALSILDDADISLSELRDRLYGASTAAAVLAYKRKREIINRTYQTQADDIVGKMTIAALDKEILAWEHQRHPRRDYYCGDPIRAGVGTAKSPFVAARFAPSGTRFQLTGSSAPTPTPVPTTPAVIPGDLDILWQPSSGAGAQANRMLKYLIKAVALLKPYGLGIVSSGPSPPDVPFPYDPTVDADDDVEVTQAFKAAEKMRPGSPSVLRILVVPGPTSGNPIYGATKSGGTLHGVPVPPFVILNTSVFRTDECTLVHEMIHAANLKLTDKDHDPDKSSVFATGNARSVLKPQHAAEFNKAFFRR